MILATRQLGFLRLKTLRFAGVMGLALENSVQAGVCLTEPPSRIVG
jgi:hypothetical protein